MGQRPKPPTAAERERAREQYDADVAAGRRIPLPDLGAIRPADGAWRPAAGEGFEIVTRSRPTERRPALNVNFNPLALRYGRRP